MAVCKTRRGPRYYLNNRSRTLIKIKRGLRRFDILSLMEQLRTVDFPLSYTEGLDEINFTILRGRYYGEWDGLDNIVIDVKNKRRPKTILATFVHEVAHHMDYRRADGRSLSRDLTRERMYRGKRIHRFAGQFNDEYFARGFERFYSQDQAHREELKLKHPQLYELIMSLHLKYSKR